MSSTRVVMHQIVLPGEVDTAGVCFGGQVSPLFILPSDTQQACSAQQLAVLCTGPGGGEAARLPYAMQALSAPACGM